MAKGQEPGNTDSAPIESRRTPVATDVGAVAPDEEQADGGEASVIDTPEMGTMSAESARPTPLDEIARIERSSLPQD